MRKLVIFLMVLIMTSCTVVEVGKVKKERKELYDYNNSQEFCEQNPSKCVNGVPWM